MQTEPSEGRPHKSRFGGGFISPVQFLAENMCARLARRDRVELGDRFWESPRWEKEFVLQTVHAARLLQKYSLQAVIAALRTTRGLQVYSLGYKSKLVPLVEYEQERLRLRRAANEVKAEELPQPPSEPAQAQAPRPPQAAKPSLRDKLR